MMALYFVLFWLIVGGAVAVAVGGVLSFSNDANALAKGGR